MLISLSRMLFIDVIITLLKTWLWNRTNPLYRILGWVVLKHPDFLWLFLLIINCFVLLGLSEYCLSITRHDDLLEVCAEQMVNVCSQSVCQCYTAFASESNACIISSYSTSQRLGIILTLSSLFSSIFWQERQPWISKICVCSVKYQLGNTLGLGDIFYNS